MPRRFFSVVADRALGVVVQKVFHAYQETPREGLVDVAAMVGPLQSANCSRHRNRPQF